MRFVYAPYERVRGVTAEMFYGCVARSSIRKRTMGGRHVYIMLAVIRFYTCSTLLPWGTAVKNNRPFSNCSAHQIRCRRSHVKGRSDQRRHRSDAPLGHEVPAREAGRHRRGLGAFVSAAVAVDIPRVQ